MRYSFANDSVPMYSMGAGLHPDLRRHPLRRASSAMGDFKGCALEALEMRGFRAHGLAAED